VRRPACMQRRGDEPVSGRNRRLRSREIVDGQRIFHQSLIYVRVSG
jgi:hypothetical protein